MESFRLPRRFPRWQPMDSRGVQFFRGTAERCRRSKCPSWRAEATVRPRRQGRVVGVHRSEEESLDGRGGRIRRRIESGRAMGHEVEIPTTSKEQVLACAASGFPQAGLSRREKISALTALASRSLEVLFHARDFEIVRLSRAHGPRSDCSHIRRSARLASRFGGNNRPNCSAQSCGRRWFCPRSSFALRCFCDRQAIGCRSSRP